MFWAGASKCQWNELDEVVTADCSDQPFIYLNSHGKNYCNFNYSRQTTQLNQHKITFTGNKYDELQR